MAPATEIGEAYMKAGVEHLSTLDELYERRHYVIALYLSGLAVECLLRAYRMRIDAAFDARHNLYAMSKSSGFQNVVPIEYAARYADVLATVASRWSNSLRYKPEGALKRFFKQAGLDRGIKGDFIKENVRRAINASIELVSLGQTRWKS